MTTEKIIKGIMSLEAIYGKAIIQKSFASTLFGEGYNRRIGYRITVELSTKFDYQREDFELMKDTLGAYTYFMRVSGKKLEVFFETR